MQITNECFSELCVSRGERPRERDLTKVIDWFNFAQSPQERHIHKSPWKSKAVRSVGFFSKYVSHEHNGMCRQELCISEEEKTKRPTVLFFYNLETQDCPVISHFENYERRKGRLAP